MTSRRSETAPAPVYPGYPPGMAPCSDRAGGTLALSLDSDTDTICWLPVRRTRRWSSSSSRGWWSSSRSSSPASRAATSTSRTGAPPDSRARAPMPPPATSSSSWLPRPHQCSCARTPRPAPACSKVPRLRQATGTSVWSSRLREELCGYAGRRGGAQETCIQCHHSGCRSFHHHQRQRLSPRDVCTVSCQGCYYFCSLSAWRASSCITQPLDYHAW